MLMFCYIGSKACAYNVHSATFEGTHPKPTHLLFYVNDVTPETMMKLHQLYDQIIIPPPGMYSKPASVTEWKQLFAIPLMLPDSRIIYNIIPDTTDGSGRTYLKEWINNSRPNSWLPVDYTLEFVDEWEIFITLDANSSYKHDAQEYRGVIETQYGQKTNGKLPESFKAL